MASRLSGAPAERKQAIARATCRAIIEQGLHQVNLRDIARALGTTTGPLQHYFRSKEELLLYTKNLLIDELLQNARDAGFRHSGLARLRLVCERLLPFPREYQGTFPREYQGTHRPRFIIVELRQADCLLQSMRNLLSNARAAFGWSC